VDHATAHHDLRRRFIGGLRFAVSRSLLRFSSLLLFGASGFAGPRRVSRTPLARVRTSVAGARVVVPAEPGHDPGALSGLRVGAVFACRAAALGFRPHRVDVGLMLRAGRKHRDGRARGLGAAFGERDRAGLSGDDHCFAAGPADALDTLRYRIVHGVTAGAAAAPCRGCGSGDPARPSRRARGVLGVIRRQPADPRHFAPRRGRARGVGYRGIRPGAPVGVSARCAPAPRIGKHPRVLTVFYVEHCVQSGARAARSTTPWQRLVRRFHHCRRHRRTLFARALRRCGGSTRSGRLCRVRWGAYAFAATRLRDSRIFARDVGRERLSARGIGNRDVRCVYSLVNRGTVPGALSRNRDSGGRLRAAHGERPN
jgi:hypothetical protein